MMPNRTHPNQRTEGEKKPFLHYCFLLASKGSLRPPERGSPLLPPLLSSRRGGNPALEEEKTLSAAAAADAIVGRSVGRRWRGGREKPPAFTSSFSLSKERGGNRQWPTTKKAKNLRARKRWRIRRERKEAKWGLSSPQRDPSPSSLLSSLIATICFCLLSRKVMVLEEEEGLRRTKRRMCSFHSTPFFLRFQGVTESPSSPREIFFQTGGDASFLSLSFRR